MKIIKKFLLLPILLLLIGVIYFYGLDKSPVHLNQDEMAFGLSAYSISKTGTDFLGNPFPFYFWQLGMLWATPIVIYVSSLFLKFLPFGEVSIRIPGVVIALLSIFLLAAISKKIFGKGFYFFVGLTMAATVPVLFINFRIAMDVAWQIPFVVIWLLFLKIFIDRQKLVFLFLAGLTLGFGIHSYHAAKVTMPIYFVASVIYLFLVGKAKLLNLGGFLIGFLIPIIIFIPWLRIHPDTLLNQVSYVGSIDKSVDTTKGIWGVFNLNRLTGFTSSYFTYFSPKVLFVEGDRSLIHSTGKIGVFSFGMAFFILFGILEVLRRKDDWFSKLILFGFLTYPIAPSIVNDPQRISRGLVVVPFAVLLAVYGIYFLRNQKDRIFKTLSVAIIIFIIVDFGIFLNDYFGNYRVRSWRWFNGGIGNLYESVIKSTDTRKVDNVYIDSQIYFAETYFDFYQLKFSKDLKSKTKYFNPIREDFSKFPKGSLVALSVSSVAQDKPNKIGQFEKIETIRELDGTETFLVYYY